MEKIPIPSHYHDYASQSTSDITSNIGFICVGLYILYKQQKISLLAIHIICIGIFSSYYHLQPSKERIVYDMLAVITTHIIVLSHFLDTNTTIILYICSVFSVLYWKKYNDLRLYILILVGAPLYLLMKLHSNQKVNMYVYIFVAINITARILEYYDKDVYKLTNKRISGHTTKHLLGVIGLLVILRILMKLNKI